MNGEGEGALLIDTDDVEFPKVSGVRGERGGTVSLTDTGVEFLKGTGERGKRRDSFAE